MYCHDIAWQYVVMYGHSMNVLDKEKPTLLAPWMRDELEWYFNCSHAAMGIRSLHPQMVAAIGGQQPDDWCRTTAIQNRRKSDEEGGLEARPHSLSYFADSRKVEAAELAVIARLDAVEKHRRVRERLMRMPTWAYGVLEALYSPERRDSEAAPGFGKLAGLAARTAKLRAKRKKSRSDHESDLLSLAREAHVLYEKAAGFTGRAAKASRVEPVETVAA